MTRRRPGSTSTPRARYSDDEIALLADRSIGGAEVAEKVGISRRRVYEIRSQIKDGSFVVSSWLDSEVDFILENIETMNAAQMADYLGRSRNQVNVEIRRLQQAGHVAKRTSKSFNPHQVGNRPLLARTCIKCGLFLGAEWFPLIRHGAYVSWSHECKHCSDLRHQGDKKRRGNTSEIQKHKDFYNKMQEYTKDRAENHRKEWTSEEIEIATARGVPALAKALELKRTYSAVIGMMARCSDGPDTKWTNPEEGEWRLFWDLQQKRENTLAGARNGGEQS